MTDLSESFEDIINQCDSACAEAKITELSGKQKNYCVALTRTISDLVKEIRLQMSQEIT